MKNTWRFGELELKYIKEVLGSGEASGTTGGMNQRFEKEFSTKVNSKYAVTFNSGTGTLHAALYAAGVGAGDEVIMPPLNVVSTFYATISQNAVPVFADIDPDTFNIDPQDIENKITENTKAIVPVSLYGLSCDLHPIMELAKKYELIVINDAAEAHMALYKQQPIADFAHMTSYSLENTKHITTGDGGIIVTNDEYYAKQMRKFGSMGYAAMKANDGRIRRSKDLFQDPTYKRHDDLGFNFRMPEVAAAVALAQTERMDFFINLRIDIAKLYNEVVKSVDYLIPQKSPEGYLNTYWTYAVKYERNDISWNDFREKYIEFGGDGIYAAWALTYYETYATSGKWKEHCPWLYNDISLSNCDCPVSEDIQPKLMLFVNNYGSVDEALPKVDALSKTIEYFK